MSFFFYSPSTHLLVCVQGDGDQCSSRQTSRRAAHLQELWPPLRPQRASVCHHCHIQTPHHPTRYLRTGSQLCWLSHCSGALMLQCIYTTTGWCQGKRLSNPTLGGFTSWDWVTIKLHLSMCVVMFLNKLSSAVLSECQPCCCSRMGGWGCVDSRIHRRATQKA